jgi:hypothetical protein
VYVVNTHVPVTYINDGGQQSGYAVSLLQNIAKETGLTFSWVPFSNVPEMRDALKRAPDSLIAAADASATHEPDIIYSRPYQISNWVLVTRSAFPAIRSLSDMKENAWRYLPAFIIYLSCANAFLRWNLLKMIFAGNGAFTFYPPTRWGHCAADRGQFCTEKLFERSFPDRLNPANPPFGLPWRPAQKIKI